MTYTKVDVSEQQLEHLVRHNAALIEEGLVYVDHQKPTAGGRLDVLMVDSGKSLVVAELKVTQDDGMLLQGLDYYDYVSTHVESYARLYKTPCIDPTQQVRLFLVAPTFSQTLVNRCKWLDLPISLFTP
ncbi:MAG: endonuclease NucS [Bryobacterales bacterium]|nr:endonuclease NucS [Bryobacterales bacterium]